MTLRLGQDEAVVAVPIPEPIRGVSEDVALVSVDRERGLALRNLASSLPGHHRGRMRERLTDEQHVA